MEQMNQRPDQVQIEARYRIQLIVWLALLFSVVIYFGLTRVIGVPVNAHPNMILVWILMALGILTVALSFLMKRRFMAQAIEQQSQATAQSGMIVALALCESTALFGLVVFFTTGSDYYYLFFIASVLGMLLHRPRRDELRAASFKNGGQGFTM